MDGLTPAAGALVEPLSIITNALFNKCNIKPGDDVVVTGCGIIGLMSAEVARASGARVAITGIAQDRDTRKDEQGVPFGDHGADGKIDLLIECSGVPQVLSEAISVVRPEGDICVIATYGQDVEINATHLTRTSLNMRGSMGSCRDELCGCDQGLRGLDHRKERQSRR